MGMFSRLGRMLKVLERVSRRLEGGEHVDPRDLEGIIEFLRMFADRCHHGKEEDRLFPAMEAAGIPMEGGPITVMLKEHKVGRGFVGRMAEAVLRIKEGDENVFREFVEAARSYIALLTQHIEKEDKILFPMAEHYIPRERRAELLESFEREE